MDNYATIFNPNERVVKTNAFDEKTDLPHNVEICMTRIPIREKDGYSRKAMGTFATKLSNSMVKNGIVFLICYAPIEQKSRPFEVANLMEKAGFTHIDNIIIEKSWLPGKRSEANLVNSYDIVLHFCNGDAWIIDRVPVKKYLGLDPDLSCPGNIWKVDTGSLDEAFSLDLAKLLLEMTNCLPGAVVFDPFVDTKNSLTACLDLGLSFFGYGTNDKKLKMCEKLIKDYKGVRRLNDLPKNKGKRNRIRKGKAK